MIKVVVDLAKYVIFIFNFIFVVFGALLIVFGLLPIVNAGYDSTYSKIAIAVGVIVFVISFLGCCGAVRENKNLLTAHAAILIILFIIQMVMIIIVVVAGNDSYNTIDDKLSKYIYSVNDNDLSIMRDLEKWFECCGVHNSTDYTSRGWPLPGSCCGESDDVNPKTHERTCYIGIDYKDGCGEKMRDYIKQNYKYVTCIVIGSAMFEIFGGIFTLWTRDHLAK